MDVRVEFVGREISMWRDHVIQRNFISGKDIVDSRSHRSNFNSLLISFFFFFCKSDVLLSFSNCPRYTRCFTIYVCCIGRRLCYDHYNSSASSFVNTRLGIISIRKTGKSIDTVALWRIDNLFGSKRSIVRFDRNDIFI